MNNYNKNLRKQRKKQYKVPYEQIDRVRKRKENKERRKIRKRAVRRHLLDLVGEEVQLSAIVARRVVLSTMGTDNAILLTNCVLNDDKSVDHLWVIVTDTIRKKLLLTPISARVFFTATVTTYTSKKVNESFKVGVTNVKLVK